MTKPSLGDPARVAEQLSRIYRIASDVADGHVTIFRFTTEWKAAWGTPNLDTGAGRDEVGALPGFPTLDTALDGLLGQRFGSEVG
jgi:hypothetical protein